MVMRTRGKGDLHCFVCGQHIDEEHALHVHKRGTRDEYLLIHGDCLDLYKGKIQEDAQ